MVRPKTRVTLMILLRVCFLPLLAILIAAYVAGCSPARPASPPLLRLVAHDFSFDAPHEARAGLTRIRLVNRGHAWHYVLLAALPDSETVETYLAGARAGEEFPASAVDIGGTGLVPSGDSTEVLLDLRPGRYALVCWYDKHIVAGMIAPLTVTDASALPFPHPVADTEVVLKDFAFEFSKPLRPGLQLLHVTNVGRRPHEFDVYRLTAGHTREDFERWQATHQGVAPAVPVGGVADFVPGREVWVLLALRSGRYLMRCEVPEGEQTHADMGMVAEFEIP